MRLFEFTEELNDSSIHDFLVKVGSYRDTGVIARASIAFILDTAHITGEESERALVRQVNEMLVKYRVLLIVKYIDLKRKEIWYYED